MTDLHTASEVLRREAIVSIYAGCTPPIRDRLGRRLEQIGDAAVSA